MRTNNNIAGKINFYLSGMPDMEAARPHDFLCQMDEMEDAMLKMCNHLAAQIDYGNIILAELPKLKASFGEDLLSQFESEQDFLSERYRDLLSLKRYLSENPEMFRPHDTLPDSLDRAISVTKAIFDQQEEIRWAIMEHNADCSKKSKGNALSTDEEIDNFFSSL